MTVAAKLTRTRDAKLAIKDATAGKGRNMTGVTFEGYAYEISAIVTGVDISDADAAAADVVTSKTFYATSGGKQTGTMTDNGTVSTDISAKDNEITIASGKHSGAGVVKISAAEQAKIIDTNVKSGITILGVTGTFDNSIGTGSFMVRWFDYDGTILKLQRVNSGGNVTHPSDPSHPYVTFSEWNNSNINITHDTDIGALYTVTDGKTYLFITVNAITGLSPVIYLNKTNTALITIDWADGHTSTSSASGNINLTNTYAVAGDYIVTIECSGEYKFGNGAAATSLFGNGNYRWIATKIFVGSNVISMNAYGLYFSCVLTSIIIPNTVTSYGSNALAYCRALKCVITSANVTTIADNVFSNCGALLYGILAQGIAYLNVGAFASCIAMCSCVIPDTVTNLGQNAFYSCTALVKVYIPSITTIGISAFYNCTALSSVENLGGVSTIGTNTIGYCIGLEFIVCNRVTPPTLSNVNAFSSLPLSTKIYVPDASVTAYKTATNWITYANYIYPLSTKPA